MSAYNELTSEELLALPTNRLYAVYKLYRQDSYNTNYHTDEYGDYHRPKALINNFCDFIKGELDKRGHVPRKHNSNTEEESPRALQRQGGRYYTEPAKPEPTCSIENPEDAIGLQVYKKSKKPFKSKNLYNTVKSVTVNPHTHRVAFDFEEDSSIVDVHVCHLRKIKS